MIKFFFHFVLVCGGEFTIGANEKKTLSISRLPANQTCEYLFTAPVGKHVRIDVKSMSLPNKDDDKQCGRYEMQN